jgi:glycosyltransferase involved in cell wall biosynthesis
VRQRPIRVARIIARLNIGGPAIQAITLTQRLRRLGYNTLLLRGKEGPLEGTMDALAEQWNVAPVRVPHLRRELGLHDLFALVAVVRALRRFKPDVLHTHAAKGGAVGRMGALILAGKGPRVLVHTFHGHVLEGYFHPAKARAFATLERWLAKRTTRLIAVSGHVRDDLVRMRIAPASKIEVIPLGFDLSKFLVSGDERDTEAQTWRRRVGLPEGRPMVLLVARLVPIKRVDRFLRVARLASQATDAHFVVVGDGDLRAELMTSADAAFLGERLHWAGFEADVAPAMFAADLVVLTSDNEGTPVSLIEAHASALPAVCSDAGGVRAVVLDGVTGFVRPRDDLNGLAHAIRVLLSNAEMRSKFGAEGRAHVLSRFDLDRLVADLDRLYRNLLIAQGGCF